MDESGGLLATARRLKEAAKELADEKQQRIDRRDALWDVAFELSKALEVRGKRTSELRSN